ncbi:unnamed protein product [Enterobius vermicularis]|uniref:Transposase n=1 Tax=Enterobius vermicularis TaxID=51028 RepID=A0A0N4VRT3_ENTVE|nr:unnamed protein product [Enterobius vermicularis]
MTYKDYLNSISNSEYLTLIAVPPSVEDFGFV